MKNVGRILIPQSSYPLKELVAHINPQFQDSKQHDIDEFLQVILKSCRFLDRLTHFTVQITRICKICKKVTSSEDERNILYENLDGDSITEIIPSIEKPWPDFKTNCIVCKAETWHDKYEKILILPKVLIVNLQRFKRGRSNRIIGKNCMNVDPSIILTLDETLYSLNAVVTHYGRTTNEGEHDWFIKYHIVLNYLEITLQSTTNLTILCMKLSR